ncbi:alginate O-acetyltransferase AlgX-related protein [Brachyspira murdochii]|uniref:alginate O-acetyltransferase AlgX-related protein n=1 Tax=Brachyspira murdochii TaxID=84378 RepID=UPI0012F4907A|nr:hypothetical protein [Brachyspira murdochii]
MKLKKVLIGIYISLLILFVISLIVLIILGSKERVGYLSEISLNIEETLNKNTVNINDIVNIEEYILTNNSITNYIYNFRISYYSKVFRNSDIYGVYLSTDSLPNYIKDIEFDKKGSPFGILISSDKIESNIDNIKYFLKLKFSNLFLYLILFYIFVILVYIFRKSLFNIFHYTLICFYKYKKLLLIYFIVYIFFVVSLFILGIVSRIGYLSDISINSDDTLRVNNINMEITDKLDYSSLTNYIFTNYNISKYIYNFRISYYSKIFRNSDIYGVYLSTDNLPNYIKDIEFDKKGSPFGIFTSDRVISENIDNIQYSLKLKLTFLLIILLLFIVSIIFIEIFLRFYNLYIKINYYKYYTILIIFLCFLIMPNVIYKVFYDKFDHTNYENRNKAKKPLFAINNLYKYPGEYEKYFNDYIPFRNEIIRLKNLIDLFLFRNFISDITLLGKDKWLFFKKVIENYIIDTPYFSDEELEKAKNILLNFRDELKKQNIDFIFMICPNKESIYTNYIPSYIKPNISDKFVEYIRKNTDIKILYPREQLMKYKDKYQLYYKYDHHWNALGGYIAYSELMKLFNINVKDLESLNILSFDYRYRNNLTFYNQTANSVHLSDLKYFRDDNIFVISNFISKNTNIMINNVLNWELNYYYTNEYLTNTNKIYIIRDSMIQELLDYIFPSFKETIAVSFSKFNKFDIIKQRPDIVIYSILEGDIKLKIFDFMANYRIEEINKDLETNYIVTNN